MWATSRSPWPRWSAPARYNNPCQPDLLCNSIYAVTCITAMPTQAGLTHAVEFTCMKVSEHIVGNTEIDELTAFVTDVLKQTPALDGSMESIDETIHEWQASGKLPNAGILDKDELIALYGYLWGNEIVRLHGWHWADLIFHEFDDWVGRAVVSPDASLFILPVAHIHECLQGDDEVKITALLSAIGSDIVPSLEPCSYTNMAHNIQRIVPRP